MEQFAYNAFCKMRDKGLKISSAESCTGGLFAKMLTDIPGSSAVLDVSIVTYANEAKTKFLGVSEEDIKEYGVVSRAVAESMAKGVKGMMGADIGVGITGIAGPDGGSEEKPVGTVWTAVCIGDTIYPEKLSLDGTREEIRYKTCEILYNKIAELI